MKKPTLKQKVHQSCLQLLIEKMDRLDAEIQHLQMSFFNEEKSSAGDKYETGRERLSQDLEGLNSQLMNAHRMKDALEKIDPAQVHGTADTGALVSLSNGVYYMAVGLGRVELEGMTCFVISPEAPLFRALKGSTSGSSITFRGQSLEVKDIC